MSNTYTIDLMAVRMEARTKLIEWGAVPGETYAGINSAEALAELLGFESFGHLQNAHGKFGEVNNHDLHNLLLALAGPNGYAIYKAMLAQKEEAHEA